LIFIITLIVVGISGFFSGKDYGESKWRVECIERKVIEISPKTREVIWNTNFCTDKELFERYQERMRQWVYKQVADKEKELSNEDGLTKLR